MTRRPWLAALAGIACATAATRLHAQEPGAAPGAVPQPPRPGAAAAAPPLAGSSPLDDDVIAARCRALAAEQDRGALTIDAAVAALGSGDEPIARTAAAIVRHEWLVLSPDLFAALDRSPAAARMLLHELAVAPRPAAAAWAASLADPAPRRSFDDRCLALAARGTPLAAAEAELLLHALAEGGPAAGAHLALAVLAPRAADGLLGRIHAALQAAVLAPERVLPVLERMSPNGWRGITGLVHMLPAEVATPLVELLHTHRPDLALAGAATALDAPGDLALAWLPHCAPLLDTPARVERVAALLRTDATPVAAQRQAFLELVAAGAVNETVLDLAESASPAHGTMAGLRRLLDAQPDRVPVDRLLRWLAMDTETATVTAQALGRRARLEPELERALLAKLAQLGPIEEPLARTIATTLVQRGGTDAINSLWPALRASSSWLVFVDAAGRRGDPFLQERLRAELGDMEAAGNAESPTADAISLALVAAGDEEQLRRLVSRAPRATPAFVRRCAHHTRSLPTHFATYLLDHALATGAAAPPGPVALELIAWAARAVGDPEVADRLRAVWERPPDAAWGAEARELVLRALAGSTHRPSLCTSLRTALAAGPLPDELEPLTFELVATMPQPPAAEDLALATDLVLLAPRTDPEREAALAKRWPDGTAGFPLTAALAERVRRAPPDAIGAAFAAAVRDARADPRHVAIAPGRLLVLWRHLLLAPDVQLAVGSATAPLFLALPTATADSGPAHWFAARACLARGELAPAAVHAAAARNALLRLPARRRQARLFLGERDPVGGHDPWAALAALPHVAAWRAATARGDAAAAATEAARVREFAGHDRATLATLAATTPPTTPETGR